MGEAAAAGLLPGQVLVIDGDVKATLGEPLGRTSRPQGRRPRLQFASRSWIRPRFFWPERRWTSDEIDRDGHDLKPASGRSRSKRITYEDVSDDHEVYHRRARETERAEYDKRRAVQRGTDAHVNIL